MRVDVEQLIASHLEIIKRCKKFVPEINRMAHIIYQSILSGGCVYWYGNGGSAADAQHMAAELVSRFKAERRAIGSVALTTDTSILTAIGNDYTFDNIFQRQVEALVKKQDVCIGLSTSGNSKNVYKAHVQAKKSGAKTVSLLGSNGGMIKEVSDLSIIVPSSDTPRIQEAHTLFAHIICELIESKVVSESVLAEEVCI